MSQEITIRVSLNENDPGTGALERLGQDARNAALAAFGEQSFAGQLRKLAQQILSQWRRQVEDEDPEYAEVLELYNYSDTEATHFASTTQDGIEFTLTVTIPSEKNSPEALSARLKSLKEAVKDLERQIKGEMGKPSVGRTPDALPLEQERYYRHIHLLIKRKKKFDRLFLAKREAALKDDYPHKNGDYQMLEEFDHLYGPTGRESPKPLAIQYLKQKFNLNLTASAIEKKLYKKPSKQ